MMPDLDGSHLAKQITSDRELKARRSSSNGDRRLRNDRNGAMIAGTSSSPSRPHRADQLHPKNLPDVRRRIYRVFVYPTVQG
jgi:hypothetical protein